MSPLLFWKIRLLLLWVQEKGSYSCCSVVDWVPTLDVLCETGFLLGSINSAATEDLAVAALGVEQGTLGPPTMAGTCLRVPYTLLLLLLLWLIEAITAPGVHVGPHCSCSYFIDLATAGLVVGQE